MIRRAAEVALASVALPVLAVVALLARRRHAGARRVVWTATPIISLRYWSEAVRRRGFESTTVVWPPYRINQAADFDRLVSSFPPRARLLRYLRPYFALGWMLRNADVVCTFLDGGPLAPTPLGPLEHALFRLARVATVVTPYGSDIAVPGRLGPLEQPILATYPEVRRRADATRRRVDRVCRSADVVVANFQLGYLPRRDVFWPTQLCVDTDTWRSSSTASDADGRHGEVVVVHPSNHRPIKRTDAVVAAVDRLAADGLAVRLELLEGLPNDVVRERVARADVVVEQLIRGYSMVAVEAMSAGKPVVSNLSALRQDAPRGRWLEECPIVDADADTLAARLEELIRSPARRAELGRRGREYALRFHSYDAIGSGWETLLDAVLSGARPPELLEP